MFEELDTVVLTRNIKEYGLKTGDIGAIVHVYKKTNKVEVEFVAASGRTVALITVTSSYIRPMARDEILHVRSGASV